MTTITNDTATQAAGTKAPAAPNSLINADFTMFLSLLTAQMQNQDPLDPMDTSEYTQQLVQYSQVEQSIQQSGTLKDILSKLTTQDMAQASSFIGREARFATNTAGLTHAPALWTYTADRQPGSLSATVSDSTGRVVKTASLTAETAGQFSWDGTMADGTRAPEGTYSLSLNALDASGKSIPTTINSIGTVKDVVSADGQNVMLGVNGARFPLSSLIAIAATEPQS